MIRILRTTIGVEIQGVSEPISLWVVRKDELHQLSIDELQPHMQAVSTWEEQERRMFFSTP